ncbi:helix-turn-helix domain-containing protein [Streptomyces sp. NPDC002809]|uniref:helix-turn-helix domain-containing protein n=1 Tax=Streptomyces sp. NPDC002809 TaxID=3154433 RepID=UPI00332FD6BC
MNTTTAANTAKVTVATIRDWARRGIIAATKVAGRWVIDTNSLTHRINIGAMRTRKTAPVINLGATYSYTPVGNDTPRAITPVVKRRMNGRGINIISVSNLTALFADRFDAITDEGDRLHALTVFAGATIAIWENGELRTTYRGGAAGITVDDVLGLAAKLRTQLAA